MLRIELSVSLVAGAGIPALRARYINAGTSPLALAPWWTRTLVVRGADGQRIEPGPGPVLPCGAAEDWNELAPGESLELDQPLQCTQPAGQSVRIGWSYALGPGDWRVSVVMEAPATHGFTQSTPHPHAFNGRAQSNEVTLTVPPPPPGLFERMRRCWSGP